MDADLEHPAEVNDILLRIECRTSISAMAQTHGLTEALYVSIEEGHRMLSALIGEERMVVLLKHYAQTYRAQVEANASANLKH